MSRIIKNCPCTLEVWSGPDEPILKEWNMYFNCKNEIKEYLNNKLQEFKGDMVECYVFINYIRANLVKYRCVLK